MLGGQKMTKLVRLISIGLVVAVIGLFLPAQRVSIEGIGTLSVGQQVAYASPDVEILRPDALGDECDIVGEVGADCPDHYLNVYEEVPDGNTTCVYTGAIAYQRDLYNIADHSAGSGTINYITVYARCGANVVPSQASLKLAGKTGGTVYESEQITVTYGWANYSRQVAVNPKTGNPWTWDEIDNLQIGISLRRPRLFSGVTGCTQVWVAVNYTPVTIDITAPADIAGWNLTPLGTQPLEPPGTQTLTVTCNGSTWTITATDEDTTNTNGHMTKYSSGTYVTSVYLCNAMLVEADDGTNATGSEVTLPTGGTILTGTGAVTSASYTIHFKQTVLWTDPVVTDPDCYRIVVTFIGSTP